MKNPKDHELFHDGGRFIETSPLSLRHERVKMRSRQTVSFLLRGLSFPYSKYLKRNQKIVRGILHKKTLRKKCPYLELFWSVFSRIRTEYGEILCISLYSVRMRENTDQNNCK